MRNNRCTYSDCAAILLINAVCLYLWTLIYMSFQLWERNRRMKFNIMINTLESYDIYTIYFLKPKVDRTLYFFTIWEQSLGHWTSASGQDVFSWSWNDAQNRVNRVNRSVIKLNHMTGGKTSKGVWPGAGKLDMAWCSSDRILCERGRGFAGGLINSCETECQCSLGWSTAASHTDKALGVSEGEISKQLVSYNQFVITKLPRV